MTRGRAPARGERGSGTVSVLGTAALGAGLLLAVAALGQASGSLIARPAMAAGLDPMVASLVRVVVAVRRRVAARPSPGGTVSCWARVRRR